MKKKKKKIKRIWLKQIRDEKNMSQKDVAQLVKKTEACYCQIENGTRNPSVKLAQQIANILDFDWTLFFQQE